MSIGQTDGRRRKKTKKVQCNTTTHSLEELFNSIALALIYAPSQRNSNQNEATKKVNEERMDAERSFL